MQDPRPPRRPTAVRVVPLIALVVLAAALRGGVIAARWHRLARDPDAYRLIAEHLVHDGVFSRSIGAETAQPTAFRPPLYPLLLAATAWQGRVTPAAVAAIHILAGSLTVLLVWRLAERCGLGRRSYLAALLVAADPILLNQSAEIMTETVATLLAVLGLLTLVHWSHRPSCPAAARAGAALGLATLCRPTFLVWAALCGVYMLASERSGKRLAQAAAFAAALCIVLSPWGLRNRHLFGRTIITTTHGGYTLLLGNNPYFYEHLRSGAWGSVWDAAELEPMIRDELADVMATAPRREMELVSDRRLYELAWQAIREQPGMFLYASLTRLGSLWSPLAHQVDPHETRTVTLLRWGVAAWYVGLLAWAVVRVARLRGALLRTPWVWGTWCVLAFMLLHSVYWTNMRMRAPLMPIVALVAVAVGKPREPAEPD